MIRSAFMLLCISIVPLGGFVAGAMLHFVKKPELYGFILFAGIALSLCGCFGFAALDREDGERHRRNLGRAPSIPGREG